MTMVRIHALVHGRVQGVFFRDSTRHEAIRLGLTGWVRNLPDGAVETEFEGAPDAAAAMGKWLAIGPPLAQVLRIAQQPIPATAAESDFRIRY